jgi:hypothetical protein
MATHIDFTMRVESRTCFITFNGTDQYSTCYHPAEIDAYGDANVAFYFVGEPLRSDAPDAPVMGITPDGQECSPCEGCGTVRTVDEMEESPVDGTLCCARCHAEAVVECERA